MSLSSALPFPTNCDSAQEEYEVERALESISNYVDNSEKSKPPPYGSRKGWVPRRNEDFDDGGAYPEVPCVQYPYNIGKVNKEKQPNAVPVYLGTDGKVRYDVLLRQEPQSANKIIHYKYEDMIPAVLKDHDNELEKPSEDQVEEITLKTREALEKEINTKISSAMPVKMAPKRAPLQFIRYTPIQQNEDQNSGAKQRIIRMVESQRDPMSPPRFKINNKIPAGPPSPPAPVMHSPPRKVSVKDQLEWKIPPCISNWKNPKGYTIPLDKRLASDGRGLQDPHVNDNFAKLSEALYIADRKAREAVEMRSQLEKKAIKKEQELVEEHLQKMAQKARDERSAFKKKDVVNEDEAEREKLRFERHKDRERQRRIAKAGSEKRTAYEREKERDISEKIALGMPSIKPSDDSLFDQRLFNQSRGLDSGFAGGEDEVYNVFDKPWNARANLATNIYRPGKNVDAEIYGDDINDLIKESRFVPDRGFSGVEYGNPANARQGPVQFEKKVQTQEDPFQLDKFLSEAKKGKRNDSDPDSSRPPPQSKRTN